MPNKNKLIVIALCAVMGFSSAGFAGSGLTAEQQGISQQETEVTRQVRQEIMDIKDLSVNGQNVKIITVGQKVILKGPVASAQEQKWIVNAAKKSASKMTVVNETFIQK